jgi:hypothetical protein
MRFRFHSQLLLLMIALLFAGVAIAAASSISSYPPGPAAQVTPAPGNQHSTFDVTFRTIHKIGISDGIRTDVELSASTSLSTSSCITSFNIKAPAAAANTHVHVYLRPQSLGGRWCVGTYNGVVNQWRITVCPRHQLCPTYAIPSHRIGTFKLHVQPQSLVPIFAGLQSAFACTPGPQRPGQTTSFTLSWKAAVDATTPSAQFVYDIYLSSTSGGENYTHPTWTTAPGVTSFRTPGLAAHGTFFFVVRARDPSGSEDSNIIERRGVDPCE